MTKRSTRAASREPASVQAKNKPRRLSLRVAGILSMLAIALPLGSSLIRRDSSLEFADVDAEVQRDELRSLPPNMAMPDAAPHDSVTHGALRRFAFNTSRRAELRVRGNLWGFAGSERWTFEEMEGRVRDRFANSSVIRLSPFLSQETAEQLLKFSTTLLYDDGPDTVDQRPTFEATLFRDGVLHSPRYMKSLTKAIERRAIPYVRERFKCRACVACTSIVRRYIEGERRDHPWHYDSDAYVTMVMPLTPAADYRGGLYIQPSFDRNDREFLELEAGDAVMHRFDVMHGVEVLRGERVALVIWFKSDADACEKMLSPWYEESAAAGNPTAQYNLGRVVGNGLGGTPQDRPAGVEWYRKAAKQGHVMAMYNLAVCLHHGRGAPSDEEAAVMWYAQAANAGHPLAMTNFGYMQLFGLGMPKKNVTGAAFWFQKAALQGVSVAMFQLSHLLAEGNGVGANISSARHWLELAASQGHKDSKVALLRLRAKGSH